MIQTNSKIAWTEQDFTRGLAMTCMKRMELACMKLLGDIKTNFGSGGTPNVRTGTLRSSITANWTGSGRAVSGVTGAAAKAGASGLPNPGGGFPRIKGVVGSTLAYARIQEMGGEIKPVNKQFLTIPIGPRGAKAAETKAGARRGGAREFADTFRVDKTIFGRPTPGGEIVPLFHLAERVIMPPRPYLRPALERNREAIMRLFRGKKQA